MKKLLFALSFVAWAFTSQAGTANEDLFSLNEEQVATEMAELNNLETYVSANEGLTLADIKADQAPVSSNFLTSLTAPEGEPPLGIPSFLWGCGGGILGIILVHVVAEDKAETKKAFYGCLTGTVVGTALYFVVFASQASKM